MRKEKKKDSFFNVWLQYDDVFLVAILASIQVFWIRGILFKWRTLSVVRSKQSIQS